MIEETKKRIDPASKFIEGIISVSDEQIKIAQEDISKDFKAQLQEVIRETEKVSKIVAKEVAEDHIDSVRKDMFVTFGIFTSFIAFIVGEINILKTIDTVHDKVGFSFLFVFFILGFLFGIMFLLDSEIVEYKYRKMSWVFSLFFFIGLAFITMPSLIKF